MISRTKTEAGEIAQQLKVLAVLLEDLFLASQDGSRPSGSPGPGDPLWIPCIHVVQRYTSRKSTYIHKIFYKVMNELTNTLHDHHGENDKESTFTKKMLAL